MALPVSSAREGAGGRAGKGGGGVGGEGARGGGGEGGREGGHCNTNVNWVVACGKRDQENMF